MVKPNIYQSAAHIYKHKDAKPPLILAVCPHCSTKNIVNYKERIVQCPCKGESFYATKK